MHTLYTVYIRCQAGETHIFPVTGIYSSLITFFDPHYRSLLEFS